jgi:hypothetical protein
MKKTLIGAVLAVTVMGGSISATAVAHADDVKVTNFKYATEEACEADAPNVQLTHNDAKYPYWYCKQGGNGYWYIWNSTTP